VVYGRPIEPLAIAHRGGAALAPENTLIAFARATSLGFRYLETDVRVTSDGEVVCFHDATLDRVTDGRGRVQRHNLAQLRALRVYGSAQIPTLAEVLRAFPDSNFTIDLKDEAAIEPLARVLRNEPWPTRLCIAGSWDGWLSRLARLVPGVHTALGWRSLSNLVWRSHMGQPFRQGLAAAPFAHVPIRLGSVPIIVPSLVTNAHDLGVRVVVWTVDSPTLMHRLFDAGVDGIITDRPDVLREVLIARGNWPPHVESPQSAHQR
jgi:glycerophosphoryl diester phosphodiesterase